MIDSPVLQALVLLQTGFWLLLAHRLATRALVVRVSNVDSFAKVVRLRALAALFMFFGIGSAFVLLGL